MNRNAWPILAAMAMAAPAAAETYRVVDTGQTLCYDAERAIACPQKGQPFYGQDGNFVRQPARYRDNGDGTASDLVTGLMWEKGFRRMGWADAPAHASAARTGGHADWRVPTIKELYSLMRFSGATGMAMPSQTGAPADARPYLDTSVFAFEYPSAGRYIDAQYISATAYNGQTMGRDRAFFGVNFADGRIKAYPQNGGPGGKQWYARFVRGTPDYGKNDFVENRDGTVTDRATGLTWTQADSGGLGAGKLDWRGALAFCAGLDHAGHSDWHLPDAKELHSIVDYSRHPDEPALAPVFGITPIQEADGSRNWPYAWSSTTHLDGRRPGDFAVYVAFGKAMGNMSMGMGGPRPFGGPPGPGGPGMGGMGMGGPTRLLDVHGAGAQRSSPKSGDESRLPIGAGPQGDVLRIYNYARCVRG